MLKKIKLTIVLLIVFCSINIFILSFYNSNKDDKLIEKYFIEEKAITFDNKNKLKKENSSYYIGILEIPKINLKKGFVNLNHKDNNVDKNIQILKNSIMPNNKEHILVIAAHSGNSKKSFFKNIYKLEINDNIYIYYSGYKYTYQIFKIENLEKNGTIEINKEYSAMLILTTCNQKDKTKQIVVYTKLIDKKITT